MSKVVTSTELCELRNKLRDLSWSASVESQKRISQFLWGAANEIDEALRDVLFQEFAEKAGK